MDLEICPECGSTNVKWIIPQIWSMWKCLDCKYMGPIIKGSPELAIEIREKYEKELKEGKKEEKVIEENEENEEELTDEEIEKKLDELYDL